MAVPHVSEEFGDVLDPRFQRIFDDTYEELPDMLPLLFNFDPSNGRDTTDKWQGHPEPRRSIAKVFLGNLADDQPEFKNHAKDHPDIVRRLTKLHEEWAREVQR